MTECETALTGRRTIGTDDFYYKYFMENDAVAALLDRVGNIQVLNNAARRIVGARLPESSGEPVWDLPIWGEEDAKTLRTGVDAAGRGESVRRRIPARTAAGDVDMLDISLTPVTGPDGAVEMLLLEARMPPPDVLQELGISAELADAAAHDLNNLFAGIAGNLELVARGKDLDATVRKRLRRAQRVVYRGHVLTELMDSIVLDKEPTQAVNVEEAVGSALEDCRIGLDSEIDVATEYENGLWPCQADSQHLFAALRHLIVRIHDVQSGNRGILIAASNASSGNSVPRMPSRLADKDYLLVRWILRGESPEEDAVPRKVATRPESGMGLGLRLVRAFARQSGGDLVVGDPEDPELFASLYLPRAVEKK